MAARSLRHLIGDATPGPIGQYRGIDAAWAAGIAPALPAGPLVRRIRQRVAQPHGSMGGCARR
ncbi:hypothetical protein [Verminephrobacter eiseniae]|uniref:hypothetical protein n=1 Tax=Verminephrobacter eiseniae TaxID=364317 RepID=UPI0022386FDB|nr:hypothetical protein [Verminephrobacter eiseniae]